MKKKVIIKLLETQRDKVNKRDFNPIIWVDETMNLIEQIYGKESSQWTQVKELEFKDQYPGRINVGSVTINGVKVPNERDIAVNYLQGFIEQIKYGGPPKNHSIDSSKVHIDKMLFYTFSTIIIGASFSLGLYFGNSKFDKEKIEYFRAQEKWKNKFDSILFVRNTTKTETDKLK